MLTVATSTVNVQPSEDVSLILLFTIFTCLDLAIEVPNLILMSSYLLLLMAPNEGGYRKVLADLGSRIQALSSTGRV